MQVDRSIRVSFIVGVAIVAFAVGLVLALRGPDFAILPRAMGGIGIVAGLLLPRFATLSVLWEGQAKGKETSREELTRKYEADYAGAADEMIRQLLEHAPTS